MINQIYVDLDGTVCDFVGEVCKFHNITNPYYYPENLGEYSMPKILKKKYMDIFGPLDSEFWENLPKLPWTDKLFSRIKSYDVYIATAPSGNKKCYEGKAKWVEKHYPKLLDKLLIGRAKHCYAKPGALLIDDKESNIEDFEKHGGVGLLVPQPWNKLNELHTWEYIEKELDKLCI